VTVLDATRLVAGARISAVHMYFPTGKVSAGIYANPKCSTFSVGAFDGATVGSSVVGAAVGDAVGWVGTLVGTLVGTQLGALLGP